MTLPNKRWGRAKQQPRQPLREALLFWQGTIWNQNRSIHTTGGNWLRENTFAQKCYCHMFLINPQYVDQIFHCVPNNYRKPPLYKIQIPNNGHLSFHDDHLPYLATQNTESEVNIFKKNYSVNITRLGNFYNYEYCQLKNSFHDIYWSWNDCCYQRIRRAI